MLDDKFMLLCFVLQMLNLSTVADAVVGKAGLRSTDNMLVRYSTVAQACL